VVILGIDPGFSVTGFGVLKKDGGKVYLIDYGYLKLKPSDSLSTRIGHFHRMFTNKIVEHGVTAISLETPFLGKNAQNFLKLGYLRGALYLLADTHSLKLLEFAPKEVKMSITGFGGATKDQVARAVLQLFPRLKCPQKDDVTDALAVSLCGLWKRNFI
jgi:crossover junction endodeoxyribonuclease RuvC